MICVPLFTYYIAYIVYGKYEIIINNNYCLHIYFSNIKIQKMK